MQPLQFRWGIISTGGIASSFVKDLLVDPKTRDVHDIVHRVIAVGSRTLEKAEAFVKRIAESVPSVPPIRAYGSYEEVYANKDVDAVYIGTPHTHHYVNALDAIKAKKHVLCEKPVTSNAAELRSLLAAAKEHGVFFMEAMWTRFHPLSKELKRIAEEGSLGTPVVLHADLSSALDIHNMPKTHRILDPALGGGGLLDLGPYVVAWAIITLYEHPSNQLEWPSNISASMLKTPITGVDSNTSFILNFPFLSAQAILSCSIKAAPMNPGVTIRYEHGTILIDQPIFCPKSFTVQYFEPGKRGGVAKEVKRDFQYVGKGLHYEADAVASCVREGKNESELWGHDKSLLEMHIFDEVRRQGGYKLPEGVERVI